MKYLFILGRNPELSIAEVESFLRKENLKTLKEEKIKNSLLLDLDKEIPKRIIDKLGGSIAIGIVICEVDSKELEKNEIYSGTKNNITYAIWNFSDDNSYNKISLYLKKRFREEKLKASEKNLKGEMELQDEKRIKISSGLIDEEYFVARGYFGRIIEKCKYKEIESRDIKKPVRREELSISPRLAKIMINLSEIKRGEKMLDPFCGIGTILIEALLFGIKVIGVDNDKKAIEGARNNLKWHKFNKENYELIYGDSKKIRVGKINAIVTEPELGKILRKIPTKEEAKKILEDYERLIISVLNNLKGDASGKIVFTAPLIKIKDKRVRANFDKISEKTGLKLAGGFPISEFRKNKIVGRDIVVFVK